MKSPTASTTWVYFIPAGDIPADLILSGESRLDRYLVQEVRSIRGETPLMIFPGTGLIRIESGAPMRLAGHRPEGAGGRFSLRAVVQHLHYAGRREWMDLKRIACPEPVVSAGTAAVLVPVGKSAEWWKLAQDERQILFQKTARHEGHLGICRRYADRIFQRLYHSRHIDPEARHDFLAYFEFDEADAPDFRKMISELRDIRANPEWLYVDFECEIWMRKL